MVASIDENITNDSSEIGDLVESKNNNLKEPEKTLTKKTPVYVLSLIHI